MSDKSSKRPQKKTRQRRERGRLHVVPHPKNGILQIRGTIHGTGVCKSTGTRDAAIADAMRVKLEAEMLNESVHGKRSVTTFAECVEHYLKARKINSAMRYLTQIVSDIGDRKTSELTAAAIRAYALERYPDAKNSTRNTNVLMPIRAVLRHASLFDMCNVPAIQSFEDDTSVVGAAPDAWIQDFVARCQNRRLKAYVVLTTTTACRCIDACRLRTEDIDYAAGTALVRETKNGKSRVVTVAPAVAEILKSFDHAANGTVFGWRNAQAVNMALEHECKRLGVKYYSTHKLGRHAFAERFLNAGWTLAEVASEGGWDDISVLSKRYGHLEKSRLAAKVRDSATDFVRGTIRVVKGDK